MIMNERPGTPWIKVGTYIFEIGDRKYLIIFDYFSRYPVGKELPTTTADTYITATKDNFSILNVPWEIVSDNMMFFFTVNIKHTTSNPRYSQSNDFIEKQIRYI